MNYIESSKQVLQLQMLRLFYTDNRKDLHCGNKKDITKNSYLEWEYNGFTILE